MVKQIVTLGAGHGGHDCGAIGSCGLKEKDVALAIARRAKQLLDKTGRFGTELIRSDDSYIDTDSRAKLIRELKSGCHIELHLGLFDGARSYTSVWRSADLPKDAPYAAALSHQLSRVLKVTDGGCKIRYDYSVLLNRMIRHEDYYSLIEKLQGYKIPHILLAECGHIDYMPTEECLSSPACINSMALAVARTVCGMLGERAAFRLFLSSLRKPKSYALDTGGEAVLIKSGVYNVLGGPGLQYRLVRPIRGSVYTASYEQEDDWLKISRDHDEFLSTLAVSGYPNRRPCYKPPLVVSAAPSVMERVKKSGFFYVRARPDVSADILGVISGGEKWLTVNESGWRKISFGERVGYVGAYAWE